MDMTQACATATRVLQWAASDAIPPAMPDYVTVSSTGTIGFQMRSFAQVKEWSVYLESEFEYHETETTHHTGLPGEVYKVGFANVYRDGDDPDHGKWKIHVYHHEIINNPDEEPLFPLPEPETVTE